METSTKKPSLKELGIAKLNTIVVGGKIMRNDKKYDVLDVTVQGGPLQYTTLVLLECGKPETEVVKGRFLAAGQSMIRHNTISVYVMAVGQELSGITVLGQ